MALKTVYESEDQIPAEVKGLYAESDGRYVLDLEDIDAHPKVRGVVTANKANAQKAQERLAELEQARQRLAAIPDDFDPDAWVQFKSAGTGKTDEQIAALREQHAKALRETQTKAQQEREQLLAQLNERDSFIDNQTLRAALDAAIDSAGFDPVHKPMLSKYLADNIKVKREESGKRVAYVETDLGDIGVHEYVTSFAAKDGKAYLAKASGPAGQGSGYSGPRGVSGNMGGSKQERAAAIAARFGLPR